MIIAGNIPNQNSILFLSLLSHCSVPYYLVAVAELSTTIDTDTLLNLLNKFNN